MRIFQRQTFPFQLFIYSGMYFDHPEIVPNGVQGDFRFNKSNEHVARFASVEAEVRALVEGQFMAKRIHAEDFGFELGTFLHMLLLCIESDGSFFFPFL